VALFGRRAQAADLEGPVSAGPATFVSDERGSPAVGPSWMAAPTMREAGGQMPLRGTSFHQDDLAALAWAVWDAKPASDLLTVQLAVVPTGQWAGAVGVYAAGKRVASIAADAAEQFRAVVRELEQAGRPATARAVVVGGHARGTRGGEARKFGLALISPTHPAVADTDAPFLPPECGYEAAVPEHLARKLDAALPSRAKNFIRRTTGHIDARDGTLVVDGQRLGAVCAERPEELALVRAAASAGHPTTCLVRMIRAPQRTLRVMTDLPMVSAGPSTELSFDLL
jgi:hypothetical protein